MRIPAIVIGSSLTMAAMVTVGCASDAHGPTTRPMTTSERQDAALRDPFNYSPDFDQTDSNSDWDKYDSQGMKRDIDHVLNP